MLLLHVGTDADLQQFLNVIMVDHFVGGLTDAVAEALHLPFSAISMEIVYRSLYFFTNAKQRGETDDVVAYLANEAKSLAPSNGSARTTILRL